MIKLLIKLIHKTKKTNEVRKEQFLYTMSFEEQNLYCQLHNMTFKQAENNLK